MDYQNNIPSIPAPAPDPADLSVVDQPDTVDPDEFAAAQKAAQQLTNVGTYVHSFAEPIMIDGCAVSELTFNWGGLTANDSMIIENELQMLGRTIVAPEFSGEYLLRMAVRACTTTITTGGKERRIGTEAFLRLPLFDFNRIRSRARSFLLRAG